MKALVAALKAAVTTKPPVKGVVRKGKGKKGKKEVFDADVANAQREATVAAEKQASDWGMLEPLHKILSPFISLLGPFATSQVVIAVLFALLMYTWINPGMGRGGVGVGFPGYGSPERFAAYEQIWRREESQLWDWLDDRVGLDNVYVPGSERIGKQKALNAKGMGQKMEDERMSERQMDDAIRVTQSRLEALKEAVERRKDKRKGSRQ